MSSEKIAVEKGSHVNAVYAGCIVPECHRQALMTALLRKTFRNGGLLWISDLRKEMC